MKNKLITSITRCEELWRWCSENPEYRKSDFPKWNKYGLVRNLCFACESALESNGLINCNKCYLLKLWVSKSIFVKRYSTPCIIIDSSPYSKWSALWKSLKNNNREECLKLRTKYAKQIADYCLKLLIIERKKAKNDKTKR